MQGFHSLSASRSLDTDMHSHCQGTEKNRGDHLIILVSKSAVLDWLHDIGGDHD